MGRSCQDQARSDERNRNSRANGGRLHRLFTAADHAVQTPPPGLGRKAIPAARRRLPARALRSFAPRDCSSSPNLSICGLDMGTIDIARVPDNGLRLAGQHCRYIAFRLDENLCRITLPITLLD